MRGDGRRIAGLAREPRDVIGLHVHEIHVARARADIFRRDVAPAEALDEAAVRAEDHLAIRVRLSPMITDLPPPRLSPATAFLYVIPRARRSASMIASSSLA